MTSIEEIMKHIPNDVTIPVHKTLTDIILKSKNAQMLPQHLAKSILNLYHDEKLLSEEGFSVLLETAITLEKEKVIEKFKEMKLDKAASYIGDN